MLQESVFIRIRRIHKDRNGLMDVYTTVNVLTAV
jgi:hypothetical protein